MRWLLVLFLVAGCSGMTFDKESKEYIVPCKEFHYNIEKDTWYDIPCSCK